MIQPNDPNFATPENQDADDGALNAGMPKVSAAPGKIFIILGGLVAFVLLIVWMLSGSDETVEPPAVKEDQVVISDNKVVPQPPPPPVADPLPVPSPPSLPDLNVPAPPITEPPVLDQGNTVDPAQRQARLTSTMLIVSGTAPKPDNASTNDTLAGSDPNLGFANRAFRATKADEAKAGNLGNLGLVIAQGKLIHAVLETAINTQLPGQVRAIVSRDIYAESGKNILIPKGARLIGTYNTSLLQGQDRVYIIWSRIIRPDGIDIFVNSPGVDSLGRPGVEGYLDNRYQQIFTGAILTSMLSIGVAYASEEFLGAGETTSTTNTDGSNTNTSSPTSQAAIEAAENISSVGERIVDKLLDTRPLITIDQGTKINVMLNRDLVFPQNAVIGAARMVP